MARTFCILLAEPSQLLREKIAGILSRHESVWCVVQVTGHVDLIRGAQVSQPDVVLADVGILRAPGVAAFLRQVAPGARVVGLVDTQQEPYLNACRKLRLDGVIEKGCVAEQFPNEVDQISGSTDVSYE